MKWYKKQLDALKVTNPEIANLGENKLPILQSVQALRGKNIPPQVKNFRSPVAEGKISRSKTDK
jgi:hypothetical protein